MTNDSGKNNLAEPPQKVSRVAFLGTPAEAVPTLQALIDSGYEVVVVITQPDRRRGRGSKTVASPVKQAALDLGLNVTDDLDSIVEYDVDLAIVVAFGRIISTPLLRKIPMINLHFSLLPRWRGAAPIERAILAGDTETGVCIMKVVEGLDEGSVYRREVAQISETETAAELKGRLANSGAKLVVEALNDGLGEGIAQIGESVYAKKLLKEEFKIDFAQTAEAISRRVRVGKAWAEFRGARVEIVKTATSLDDELLEKVNQADRSAGELVSLGKKLAMSASDSQLEIVEVKPAGKAVMSASAWLNGIKLDEGECLQ